MDRDEVLRGQLWRLISGGFMHANAEHLTGNLVMLFILGMACEHAFGRGPFLFLYVAACVAGSLMAMDSWTPTVGASGAIFGLAGRPITIILSHRQRVEIRDHRVGVVLAVWAIYTLGDGGVQPNRVELVPRRWPARGLDPRSRLPSALLTDRSELADRPVTRLETGVAIAVLIGTAVFFVPHLA